jgi:hypothetical protein
MNKHRILTAALVIAALQDALDPHEIVAAMQAAGPVDVVGYDACEQQMIEIEEVMT